jgi:hypothetical protein
VGGWWTGRSGVGGVEQTNHTGVGAWGKHEPKGRVVLSGRRFAVAVTFLAWRISMDITGCCGVDWCLGGGGRWWWLWLGGGGFSQVRFASFVLVGRNDDIFLR